jgi:hypothetical protein
VDAPEAFNIVHVICSYPSSTVVLMYAETHPSHETPVIIVALLHHPTTLVNLTETGKQADELLHVM